MFPDYLDSAKVLEYTDKGHFGFVHDYDENNNLIEIELCYLAIARYDGDRSFYIFGCDDHYEVMSDSPWDSPEECKDIHCYVPDNTVWHKK